MWGELWAGRREAAGWTAVWGRARLQIGGRARLGEEHTPNICLMLVTLDVSKLRGWLNTHASCKVWGELRAGRPEAAGDRGADAACMGGLDCSLYRGKASREEHTLNMDCMFVTLDVLKLSGWLNAFVPCRGSQARSACAAGQVARRWEAAGDRGARSVQGRARLQIRGQGRGRGAR